jgi:hypothetical protein
MSNRRTMTREIGTAFAVLAIYLLTILAPLHQARASQLAFQELGYATTETGWVLCTPLESSDENTQLPVSKCPATSIGKHDPALTASIPVALPLQRTALAAPRPAVEQSARPFTALSPLGARGPPVLG